MDWTKKYSEAEIEKRQEEYIKEALLMAKRAVPDENEAPENESADNSTVILTETTTQESAETTVLVNDEEAADEELTKFLDIEETNDEQSYIEVKSDLERLIDKISEGKSSEEKPLCNCPTCRKKRAGK